jgi:hypothetical protein
MQRVDKASRHRGVFSADSKCGEGGLVTWPSVIGMCSRKQELDMQTEIAADSEEDCGGHAERF